MSFTSCISKVFERLLNFRLNWQLIRISPPIKLGLGITVGIAADNLIKLETSIKVGFKNKLDTMAILLDIVKLCEVDVVGKALLWITNFLIDRSIRVVIGNCL